MSSSSSALVNEMISHLKPPIPLIDYDNEQSKIGQFYAGRSVFITGATGFIGKALVEKLLRSCPKIKRIYLLIREKRGKNIEERLNDLTSSKCFDRVRELNNANGQVANKLFDEKLCAIRGDITEERFGICASDMQLLAQECSIVFNSAATIRFVEPIDVAVRNNIFSVGQLVEFCNNLTNLEALIHLSTAYSNCHKRDTIYEIFYEPPMSGDSVQEAVDKLKEIQNKIHVYPQATFGGDEVNLYKTEASAQMARASRNTCAQQRFYFDQYDSNDLLPLQGYDDQLSNGQTTNSDDNNKLTTSNEKRQQQQQRKQQSEQQQQPYNLLEEFTRIALRRSNRPNTYAFTKAISESYLLDLVKEQKNRYLDDKIQVAIVRPSIVGGAWREPLVGLVDNFNGPTGAMLSLYTGALQAMPGRGEAVADLVPVDMVSNMVLSVAWFLIDNNENDKKQQNDAAGAGAAAVKKQETIERDRGAFVFNFVSGYQNPLHWHEVTDKIAELAYRYPSKFLARLPSSYFLEAGKFYNLYDLINHKLPAMISDYVRGNLFGQQLDNRSSSMAGYKRIRQMTETLTPFTSNQWRLCDSNTRNLFEKLAPIDKSIFHFDVKSIDWNNYMQNYIIGSRIYTLKDEAKNIPNALKTLKRREMINSCLMAFLMFVFFYLILQHFVFHSQA